MSAKVKSIKVPETQRTFSTPLGGYLLLAEMIVHPEKEKLIRRFFHDQHQARVAWKNSDRGDR